MREFYLLRHGVPAFGPDAMAFGIVRPIEVQS
jgi:hypothetical protein